MKDSSLTPRGQAIDFHLLDAPHRGSNDDLNDPKWSQSWFAPTANPTEVGPKSVMPPTMTADIGDPMDEFNKRLNASEVHRSFITLSEREAVSITVRPESFASGRLSAVTPFEVISDLRTSLAQHFYLDGLRPWLRDTGLGAKGGNSRIHFLDDDLLHRPVAMKTLDGKRGRPVQELGLLKEAIITGQLTHPGIPPVYDLWMSPSGECRFSMKKIEGRTLSEVVEAAPPGKRSISEFEAQLQIVIRVCDALAFAHDRGVLHRDVKPSNVMAGDHGEVFLMDWGCAHVHHNPDFKRRVHLPRAVVEALRTQGDAIVGTPSFMAPEQVYGSSRDLDPRADVYLLGGLLYFVLTGFAPRAMKPSARAAIESAVEGFVHNPFTIAPYAELPAKLMEVARRALDPVPSARYQSAQTFQDALRDVLRDGMWLSSCCATRGEVIYEEGDQADAVYLISKGQVRTYNLRRGVKTNIKVLGPGEVFGEAAFFTKGRREQTVEAVGSIVLTRVPKKVFEQAFYPGSALQQIVRAISVRHQGLDYT
ncbi:MAG: protein kinase domain-containing protein [Bradymonadia bacterium]